MYLTRNVNYLFIADENPEWFKDLKYVVEYAFRLNEKSRVTLIAHSMGGVMLLHFLQQQNQEWKDRHIARVITLNAAWGGTVQSIEAIAEGYSFRSSLVKQGEMRQIQRSSPSLHWLVPHNTFWMEDDIFMSTSKKNYSVANYEDFFRYAELTNWFCVNLVSRSSPYFLASTFLYFYKI